MDAATYSQLNKYLVACDIIVPAPVLLGQISIKFSKDQ